MTHNIYLAGGCFWGLEHFFKQMQGGKVLWLYVVGQLFNIALTLFAVWFLLSGVVFEVPVLDLYK